MKTTQTENNYTVKAAQIIKRAGETIANMNPSPSEVVQWLINHQCRISRSTWRQYRAALIYYYDNHFFKDTGSSDEIPNWLTLLHNTDCNQCLRRGAATSSKKEKKIPEADQLKLITFFTVNVDLRYGVATLVWLLSGIWTGLRPSEWKSAQLVLNANNIELLVINGKNTNGRSHGEQRIIHLTKMSEIELEILREHLANIQSIEDKDIEFDDIYKQCRNCLYRANKKLWPKRKKYISLYSSRHQFSADAKRSGLNQVAIAALMGHASIETAGIHYGRRSSGGRFFRVSADQNNIDRVEQLNSHREDAYAEFNNAGPQMQ